MGTDTETEEIETDSESMDTDTEDTDTKLENMRKQDQQESEMPVASTSVKPVTQGTTFFFNFTIYHVNFYPINHLHYLK